MALPTALLAMIAAFALATAAILSSIDVQQGERGDMARKEAIAAADSGANIALLRLNRFQSKLTEATPCVGPAGETQLEAGEGWCPSTPVEKLNSGTSFTYQVSTFSKTGALKVVSIGTAAGESRRVEVGLYSSPNHEVFGNEHLIGKEGIEFKGNPTIHTDVGTNGNINGIGNPHLCGNLRHGLGGEAPQPECEKEVFEGEKEVPPVILPADAGIANCRLVPNCTNGEEDTYSPERSSKEPWEASSKWIRVGRNASLTVGGTDYLACGIELGGNSRLIMAAATHVRIYIDTPEHCGLPAGAEQIKMAGGARIESTGLASGEKHVLEIYVLGSSTVPTNVTLTGNTGNAETENEVIIYAPYSEVTVEGNAKWRGEIAGKTLNIHGNPTFEWIEGLEDAHQPVKALWERTRYVECTGPTATPPDASC